MYLLAAIINNKQIMLATTLSPFLFDSSSAFLSDIFCIFAFCSAFFPYPPTNALALYPPPPPRLPSPLSNIHKHICAPIFNNYSALTARQPDFVDQQIKGCSMHICVQNSRPTGQRHALGPTCCTISPHDIHSSLRLHLLSSMAGISSTRGKKWTIKTRALQSLTTSF